MVHPTGHQSKVMVMPHNLKLAQRIGLSKYDLIIIDTILGRKDSYGSVNVDSDKLIKMLNYIDIMGLYATSDNCEMYCKIVEADNEAFAKQFDNKYFYYIGLCIDFDNRTVSVLFIYDRDEENNFTYINLEDGE